MQLSELAPEATAKIKLYKWDRIIEKHEGPETWSDFLKYYDPELIQVNGYYVLLPLSREHHPNITVLRVIVGDGAQSLTIFLKDTSYENDPFWSGYLAVCDKVPGEEFFLAIVYHEWMIIENPTH